MRRLVATITGGALLAILGGACAQESTQRNADTVVAVSASTLKDSSTPPIVATESVPVTPLSQNNDSVPPLNCSPERFGPGDTLTLRMRIPHGDYLTVKPPEGPVYFIVYPQFGNPRRRYSLIPSEDFRRVATLKLPSDVRAIVRVVGRDTVLDPVFTDAGKYLLRMGQNLEGDYSNVSYTCLLTFVQSSK